MRIDNYKEFIEDSYEVKILKDLTKFTVPYGVENIVYDIIQKYTKRSLSKDEFGNLYVNIGKSKILFTAHMDTYSQKVEEVEHVIESGFLKTDGETILGGDNKVGCAILINMINNNVSGNYYFFCGEEVGRLGSEFHNQKINTGQYDLAITFDRKEIGSVCTYQRGMKLCNDSLSKFLIQELSKSGFKFKEDYFGLSCDTFTFHEKVNNCLNISTGVYDEHKKTERVDLNYYKSVFNLCPKIDWKTVEILSGEKVREKIDVNKFNITDAKISDVLDFFVKNGYNPTGIPDYNQNIGIYTSNLYFKLKPKIFDYFYISINKSGMIQIDSLTLTKEKALQYINSYKKIWKEKNFDNTKYHIMDLNFEKNKFIIELLKDDSEKIKIEFDKNINTENELSVEVTDWIKKVLIESNILSFYK
jgi:hypothetical protein